MGTQIGSLIIDMAADVASLRRDLDEAKGAVSGAASSMISSAKLIAGAFALIRAGKALADASVDAINLADALDELSQKSGFAVEELSRLRAVPDLAGVAIDDLGRGLKDFNKSLVEAGDTSSKSAQIFRALGVDLSGGPQEALLGTAEAFSKLEDASLRSVAASELFGKQGQAFIPALLGGRKAFEDAAREADRFGMVISTEMGKRAGEFNDNLTRLKNSTSALGIAIASPLLPYLNRMAEALLTLRGGGEAARKSLDGMTESATRLIAKLGTFRGGGPAFDAIANIASGAMRSEQPGNVATGQIRRPDVQAPPPDVGALSRALTTGTPAAAAPRAGGAARSRFTEIDIQTRALLDGIGPDDDTGVQLDERRRGVEDFERDRQRIIDDANRDIARSNTEYYEAVWRMREEDDERLKDSILGQVRERKKLEEQAARDRDITRELGLTFTSAFEDAIGGGKGLRDVLKGLESDLLRLGTRQLVTKPLLQWFSDSFVGGTGKDGSPAGGGIDVNKFMGSASGGISSLFSSAGSGVSSLFSSAGAGLSSLFSGFFADGGVVPPGRWGWAGENGPEPVYGGISGATVMPAGGGPVNVTFNISTPNSASFNGARSQILADYSRALATSQRRNG